MQYISDYIHTVQEYISSAFTYMLALISLFFSWEVTNNGAIVATFGLVLLIAKLIQEIPKAWKVLFGGTKKDTTDE